MAKAEEELEQGPEVPHGLTSLRLPQIVSSLRSDFAHFTVDPSLPMVHLSE